MPVPHKGAGIRVCNCARLGVALPLVDTLSILSLCTGYGGLDLVVQRSFAKRGIDTTITAYAEFDAHAASVFSYHHPEVPNLGDIKAIDWTDHPADIVTAGYPCQPFSQAGKRLGTDDPRHLWPFIFEAICTIRPRYTILENVSGHRSKGFDTVLGDMAEGGFDARWTSLRASDVGAPHRRERVFIIATPAADTECSRRPRRAPHTWG